MSPSLLGPDVWLDRPGQRAGQVVVPHQGRAGARSARAVARPRSREEREAFRDAALSPSATRPTGAGERAVEEEPDPVRLPEERDRDRIVHSTPFRRLAGKTQVVCSPPDHVRTRLTHAIEVAQVARGICEALGLNATLAEAAALAHDCGHTPFGHAGEDAMAALLPGGFDHAPFGADVVLAPLNLTAEVLDAVRNHSWSRPAPATPEGVVVSLADRIAYCCHDWDDALRMGMVGPEDLPAVARKRLGASQREMVGALVGSVVRSVAEHGTLGLLVPEAEALWELRRALYQKVYCSPASLRQHELAVPLLRALVERYAEVPSLAGWPDLEPSSDEALSAAVAFVVGMTDRYAAEQAVSLLRWRADRLPQSV
jgi:dGTPase